MRDLINQAVYGTNATNDIFEDLKALDSDRQTALKELKKRETQTNIYVGNKVNIRWNPKAQRLYSSIMEEAKIFWSTLKQSDKDVRAKIYALEQYVSNLNKKESFEDLIHRRDLDKYDVARLQKAIVATLDELNMLDGIIRHFLELFKVENIDNNVNLICNQEMRLLLSRLLQAVTFIKFYKEPLKIHKQWG